MIALIAALALSAADIRTALETSDMLMFIEGRRDANSNSRVSNAELCQLSTYAARAEISLKRTKLYNQVDVFPAELQAKNGGSSSYKLKPEDLMVVDSAILDMRDQELRYKAYC